MPTPTYIPLANVTLGTATSQVQFDSFPQTYRDLICVVVARGTTTLQGLIRVNGTINPAWTYQRLSGDGTNATAFTNASIAAEAFGYLSSVAKATTTDALQMNIQILDYSATDKHKQVISRASQATNGVEVLISHQNSTNAAVGSIQISTSTGNWAVGATFALYGVIS
jgi:hypothetical protein